MAALTGPERRAAVLDALVETLPPVIHEALGIRNTCVLSARVASEVLRGYGIRVRPVPVRALILNGSAWSFYGESFAGILEGSVPAESLPDDAWSIGLGIAEPGERGLHLVVTTRNPDRLIDLTLDQASRPDKGLRLEPFSVDVDRASLRAFERRSLPLSYEFPDGGRVLYTAVDDVDHRVGSDWHQGAGEPPAVRRALVSHFHSMVAVTRRRLRERLEGSGNPLTGSGIVVPSPVPVPKEDTK